MLVGLAQLALSRSLGRHRLVAILFTLVGCHGYDRADCDSNNYFHASHYTGCEILTDHLLVLYSLCYDSYTRK